MKSKKKRLIIIGAVLAVIIIAGVAVWFVKGRDTSEGTSESAVYVDSVKNITGAGGNFDRFSGVVEPQKTVNIEANTEKKVEEIYVKEGDEVKAGDKLFIYSISEAEENLAQAEIELDRIANEISTGKLQIEELKKEKAKASAEDQLEYTTRIQTAENTLKKSEYEEKSKKVEMEQLKKGITNAVVTSEMDGVVKSINSNSSDMNSYNGETQYFMTILGVGNYRIKGTVNEQNMGSIIEGQSVIVHSRVDEDQIWKGSLTAVDLEKPEKNENMYYSSSGDSSEKSSKYPFYVELETADGLMLGQHVYVEMDYGQTEKKDGLWLDSYYIVQDGEEPFVWAANAKDKIEKRMVTLGDYDEEQMKYEILDGLTKEDYIAFPDESVKEGDRAEKNIDQLMNSGNGEDGMGGSPEEGGVQVSPGAVGNFEPGDGMGVMPADEDDMENEGGSVEPVPYGDEEEGGFASKEVPIGEGSIGDGSAPVDAGMEDGQ